MSIGDLYLQRDWEDVRLGLTGQPGVAGWGSESYVSGRTFFPGLFWNIFL